MLFVDFLLVEDYGKGDLMRRRIFKCGEIA